MRVFKSAAVAIVTLLFNASLSAAECDDFNPARQLFWGDLHVHTGLSADATVMGTRVRPADAYRFALGEEIKPGPNYLSARIERKLDFVAVTDHATDIGAASLCYTPSSEVYDALSLIHI